jgi:predicted acetyltransferase
VTEPSVVLEPIAKEQAPVLLNLLELYVHDFSEHVPLDVKENGRFDIPLGDQWWTRDDHFPFFIRSEGKLCGFALARRGSRVSGAGDVMDIAEFFVLRGVRRKGIGARAAHALLDAFGGAWDVRVRRTNVSAHAFWSRTLEAWLGRPIASSAFSSPEGIDWHIFRVERASP